MWAPEEWKYIQKRVTVNGGLHNGGKFFFPPSHCSRLCAQLHHISQILLQPHPPLLHNLCTLEKEEGEEGEEGGGEGWGRRSERKIRGEVGNEKD